MTLPHLLAEIEASDAICQKATPGPWVDSDSEDCTHPVIDDADFGPHRFISEDDYQFSIHARTALPLRNAQLRLLLPFVQHAEDCRVREIEVTAGVATVAECSCGLADALRDAGVE